MPSGLVCKLIIIINSLFDYYPSFSQCRGILALDGVAVAHGVNLLEIGVLVDKIEEQYGSSVQDTCTPHVLQEFYLVHCLVVEELCSYQ